MRRLTGDRSRCVLHMQKALTEMNVKLDSVIRQHHGTDRPAHPARDHRRRALTQSAWRRSATGACKADADTIAASLQGTWREDAGLVRFLEQAMQRYDFLTQQIRRLPPETG